MCCFAVSVSSWVNPGNRSPLTYQHGGMVYKLAAVSKTLALLTNVTWMLITHTMLDENGFYTTFR